jgi:hypothetical protein
VKEEEKEDSISASRPQLKENSKVALNKTTALISREQKAQIELIKYLKAKKRTRSTGKKTSHVLKNGVPCKLDSRGFPILDPLTQPSKLKDTVDDEDVDPTSIN